MTHPILLEVPESIYQPLAAEAELTGRKIEDVALERLANDEPNPVDDPFEKFIGAFNGNGIGWADNHDYYLGENLMREMRDEHE